VDKIAFWRGIPRPHAKLWTFRKAFLFTQKRYKISKRTNTKLESDLIHLGVVLFGVIFTRGLSFGDIYTFDDWQMCVCFVPVILDTQIYQGVYLWYWRKVRSWTHPPRIGGSSCDPRGVIKAPHGPIKWAAIAYETIRDTRRCSACNSIKSKLKLVLSIATNATLIGRPQRKKPGTPTENCLWNNFQLKFKYQFLNDKY